MTKGVQNWIERKTCKYNPQKIKPYSWNALIYQNVQKFDNGSHIFTKVCGGSLIFEKFIITSAHCVGEGGNQNYSAVLVGNNLERSNEFLQIHNISIHPSYNKTKQDDFMNSPDLAILEISSIPNLTSIALPNGNTTYDFENQCLYLAEWDAHKSNTKSSSIYQSSLRAQTNKWCINNHYSFMKRYQMNIFLSLISILLASIFAHVLKIKIILMFWEDLLYFS